MAPATATSSASSLSMASTDLHIYTARPAENYNFSGRTKVLEDLHSALRGQRDAQPETSPTCCIIHGIGGIGKTETTLQYTYDKKYSQYYDVVFWIRAETPVDVLRTFAMVGEKLTDTLTPSSSRENSQERASGKQIVVAQEWLETTPSRWLLIFDNVEKAQAIKDYIPKKATCGSIIITTQLPQLGKVTRNPVKLALPSLNSAEGAELLLRSLDKNPDDASEEEHRFARRISEFVGGLPLSITTSGGYMEQSMMMLDQFLINLDESDGMWVNPVSPGVVDAGDYDKTLATAFDIALKALPEPSRKLLDIIAFLNADMIPEEMFLAQHRNASLKLLSQEENYHSLIKDLNSRQLIKKGRLQDGSSHLSIHRTLQLSLLHRLSADRCKRLIYFHYAFELRKEHLPPPSVIQVSQPDEWKKYELYVPHVISLRQRSLWPAPGIKLPIEFAQVLADIGTYMWHSGFNDEGKSVLETAEKIVIDLEHNEDHVLISDIDDVVGIIDDMIGVSYRDDSFRRRQRALVIRKTEHDLVPEAKRTRSLEIRLYNSEANYACAYLQNEHWDEAGEFMARCLKSYKLWTPTEEDIPFEYAKYYNHMAFVFMARKQPLEALKMSRHACHLIELHHKGPDAPLVQWHRTNLGNHLFHSGNIAESLRINEDCLRDRIRISTESSTWTLESHSTVAELLLRLDRPAEARTHLEKCLNFSWTEEGMAMLYFRYSRVLAAMGDHNEAEKQRARARVLKKKFLELYPQYLSASLGEAQVYDQMIPIWAGRFTGGLVQG